MNSTGAMTRVLVLGGHGFVGRHLAAALRDAGCRVICGCRKPRGEDDIAIDFTRDLTPETWRPRLAGIDRVINAVGILHESPSQRFEAIHHLAPAALFAACETAGVRRVIQISALGLVENGAETLPYFASKAAADRDLLARPLDACVLRPSLIFGLDGASSRAFLAAASLPLHFLPGKGDPRLQPIHIDDLCALVVALVISPAPLPKVVNAVGREALGFGDLLAAYRHALGLGKALRLRVPLTLAALPVRLAERLPQRVVTRETLAMLMRGNTAAPDLCAAWLGRPPRAACEFIRSDHRDAARALAIGQWAEPLARVSLALVWLLSGLSGLVFVDEAVVSWLANLNLVGSAADAMRIAAALTDLGLAALTLARPRRALWAMQIMLIALYTLLASIAVPAAWWHPFAPLAKNLPMLALLLPLWASARR